jgi:hypothetical protein
VATLVNLNTRVEKAGAGGKDKTPACDLRISTAQSPDVLAFFEPTLKQHLFNDAGPRDLADGLPLRDPHLVYPLKRDEEMTGVRVSIDYGVSERIAIAGALSGQLRRCREERRDGQCPSSCGPT